MRIDVNAFLGAYPWRRLPGTTPAHLIQAMDRVEITEAWVSHLPGLWWKDPTEGNDWLYETAAVHPRLKPVPTVHPSLPHWEEVLAEAATRGAPAVRCDPQFLGLAPAGHEMRVLAATCGSAGVPLLMSVRLEDLRQRHPLDTAGDLPASAVRTLIRADAELKLIVTHADRSFIEEVHFGSTPAEAERLWWDLSWIWGPPEDHLATLLSNLGPSRFLFGTGQPLRIPEHSVAKLDLLDLSAEARGAIEAGNARRLVAG